MKNLALTALLVVACVSVMAQATTSTISGQISDSKGQPLINATITVRRTRSADNILFNHDASEVVGPGMQANLCNILANCKPACLDIFDIRQHDPAECDHSDIFFRGGQVVNATDPCQ